MEAINEIDNQIAIITNSLDVLKTGPEILISNKTRADKAIAVGKIILSAIQENGMTPELDMRAMKFLFNASQALTQMKEGRAAVTQIMDELKKMFTTIENDLDPKKVGTITLQIQEKRNEHAKRVAAEDKRKREEAQRIADKAKEAVEIKFTIGERLYGYFNDFLLMKKSKMQEVFNKITIATYHDDAVKFKNHTPAYSTEHFEAFKHNAYSALHSTEELNELSQEVCEGKYAEFLKIYVEQMEMLKRDLIDKLPSKYNELTEQKRLADEAEQKRLQLLNQQQEAEKKRQKEIAQANAAQKEALEKQAVIDREKEDKKMREQQAETEQKRLQAEKEQQEREQQDAARLQKESEDQKKTQQLQLELNKQADTTMVMFEQEYAVASDIAAPEVRQGFEIKVLHPVGYGQIFQYWFENEGKNLPVDKIGNTKLDQMKAYCEKVAHKTGTKIESNFLQYEESFKAVNRKVA